MAWKILSIIDNGYLRPYYAVVEHDANYRPTSSPATASEFDGSTYDCEYTSAPGTSAGTNTFVLPVVNRGANPGRTITVRAIVAGSPPKATNKPIVRDYNGGLPPKKKKAGK